jgi:hypothetical protein
MARCESKQGAKHDNNKVREQVRCKNKQSVKVARQRKQKPKIKTKPSVNTLTKQQCYKKKKHTHTHTIRGVKRQHLFMQVFKVCNLVAPT